MRDLSTGLQFALITFLGMFIGHVLEEKFGFSPWGLIGGLFLGSIVGTINLVQKYK